jgi:rare lipoprotein A
MLKSKIAAAIVLTGVAASVATAGPSAAQCGSASWYALTSKTANGERMNPKLLTAAHRSLPFGTKVRVTNEENGKAVVVRINDRGPYAKGRVIDLSKAAARSLDFISDGHTRICMTRVS